MMEFKILVILHTLSASVWVGGHWVLALSVLPRAWKNKDASAILEFENSFERIGIPALLIQVVTGLRLAMIYTPVSRWFDFGEPISRLIIYKLILLAATVTLAIHARFFIIPRLTNDKIPLLGSHIIAVTLIATAFLVVGLSFRMNIL